MVTGINLSIELIVIADPDNNKMVMTNITLIIRMVIKTVL